MSINDFGSNKIFGSVLMNQIEREKNRSTPNRNKNGQPHFMEMTKLFLSVAFPLNVQTFKFLFMFSLFILYKNRFKMKILAV